MKAWKVGIEGLGYDVYFAEGVGRAKTLCAHAIDDAGYKFSFTELTAARCLEADGLRDKEGPIGLLDEETYRRVFGKERPY